MSSRTIAEAYTAFPISHIPFAPSPPAAQTTAALFAARPGRSLADRLHNRPMYAHAHHIPNAPDLSHQTTTHDEGAVTRTAAARTLLGSLTDRSPGVRYCWIPDGGLPPFARSLPPSYHVPPVGPPLTQPLERTGPITFTRVTEGLNAVYNYGVGVDVGSASNPSPKPGLPQLAGSRGTRALQVHLDHPAQPVNYASIVRSGR